MNFTPLNLPMAKLKLSKKEELIFVWCEVRKKKLLLTPEEWVRQHIIHYLINYKRINPGLIVSELEIRINQVKRRCDILVYDREKKPFLLVECKAPEIVLDAKVIQQVIHYNNQLQVPFVAISNGLQHEIIRIDYETNEFVKLGDFPGAEDSSV